MRGHARALVGRCSGIQADPCMHQPEIAVIPCDLHYITSSPLTMGVAHRYHLTLRWSLGRESPEWAEEDSIGQRPMFVRT